MIADPNNPGKHMVNPVIWLNNDVVIEVLLEKPYFFFLL
jgi:hypothetical protein